MSGAALAVYGVTGATVCVSSLSSFIAQGPIQGQLYGPISPSIAHFDSYWQTIQGAFSIEAMSVGNRSGVSLYVHLPSSSTFTRPISPLLSSLIASLEPSLLVSPSSFQISL